MCGGDSGGGHIWVVAEHGGGEADALDVAGVEVDRHVEWLRCAEVDGVRGRVERPASTGAVFDWMVVPQADVAAPDAFAAPFGVRALCLDVVEEKASMVLELGEGGELLLAVVAVGLVVAVVAGAESLVVVVVAGGGRDGFAIIRHAAGWGCDYG